MNAYCFATTADGVLSVCQAEGTDEFVASFLPRLEGGTLNEAGIISLGAFETSEAARQALVQRMGRLPNGSMDTLTHSTCFRTFRTSATKRCFSQQDCNFYDVGHNR